MGDSQCLALWPRDPWTVDQGGDVATHLTATLGMTQRSAEDGPDQADGVGRQSFVNLPAEQTLDILRTEPAERPPSVGGNDVTTCEGAVVVGCGRPDRSRQYLGRPVFKEVAGCESLGDRRHAGIPCRQLSSDLTGNLVRLLP